jgi:hypothetical protein
MGTLYALLDCFLSDVQFRNGLARALERIPCREGLPSAERPAVERELERAQAQLEAAEEKLAKAAGVDAREDVQAREAERAAAQKALADKAAAQAPLEAEINTRYAQRVRPATYPGGLARVRDRF